MIFTVGETVLIDADEALRYTGGENELDMPFTFEHTSVDTQYQMVYPNSNRSV